MPAADQGAPTMPSRSGSAQHAVSGFWDRGGVKTETNEDYNRGIYPKLCTFADSDLAEEGVMSKQELEATLFRVYRRLGDDPRAVLAFLNGDYTSDGPTDTWISSFKTGNGDCDRSARSARAGWPIQTLRSNAQQGVGRSQLGIHLLLPPQTSVDPDDCDGRCVHCPPRGRVWADAVPRGMAGRRRREANAHQTRVCGVCAFGHDGALSSRGLHQDRGAYLSVAKL